MTQFFPPISFAFVSFLSELFAALGAHFNPAGPVSSDSLTVSYHPPYRDPDTEAKIESTHFKLFFWCFFYFSFIINMLYVFGLRWFLFSCGGLATCPRYVPPLTPGQKK